jgi:hypothetical protein
MKLEVKGRIFDEGSLGSHIHINDQRTVESILRNFYDKDVIITIKPYRKSRSNAQNRWYWGVAIMAIIPQLKEQTGEVYTKEEIHRYHLEEVIGVDHRIRNILGKTVIIFDDISTSKMSTKEFGEFKDTIQAYWAERDIIIPDPNQENFLNE